MQTDEPGTRERRRATIELERRWREREHAERVTGRDVIDHHLACAAIGIERLTERRARDPLADHDMKRLAALRAAFGLGSAEAFARGDFLDVSPFRQQASAELTPFGARVAAWADEPDALDSSHARFAWTRYLASAEKVAAAWPRASVLEASGFFLTTITHELRARDAARAALEPCLVFLAGCVDPYDVGVPLGTLVRDFGYPLEAPDLDDW